MRAPKPNGSLNISWMDGTIFPQDNVSDVIGAMVKAGGLSVAPHTSVVPGDFIEWMLFLSGNGGVVMKSFHIYSLSALEHLNHPELCAGTFERELKMLCRNHLRTELDKFGLDVPDSLKGEGAS